MFVKTINSVTGQPQTQFPGKLTSISSTTRTLNNAKQTPYYPATIEFRDEKGVLQQGVPCGVFKSNFDHGMKAGELYLCNASYNSELKRVFINVSHLPGSGNIATADMFGFSGSILAPATPAINQAAAVV